jgi:hypothetical protein
MCNSELEIQRNELKKVTALRSMPAILRKQEELKKVPSFFNKKEATSFLFNKKSQKLILKPFKHRYSDTGPTRHYTPATQE